MSQFDVHRNVGAHRATIPYLVVVQSRRFDASRRRVVVPLVREAIVTVADNELNPAFLIEGDRVVLHPLQIASVGVDKLGQRVESLKAQGGRIVAALDVLLSRAWD